MAVRTRAVCRRDLCDKPRRENLAYREGKVSFAIEFVLTALRSAKVGVPLCNEAFKGTLSGYYSTERLIP